MESRWRQGCAPSKASRGGPSSLLLLPVLASSLWLGLWKHNPYFCLCLHRAFSLHPNSPLLTRTLVNGFRATQIQ